MVNRVVLFAIALSFCLTACKEAPTATDVSAGAAAFDAHCAVCHGPGGDVRRATQHNAETPDLREIARRYGGRLPRAVLAEVIDGRRMVEAHGRTMPVWGEEFGQGDDAAAKAKIETLVAYIESIQVR